MHTNPLKILNIRRISKSILRSRTTMNSFPQHFAKSPPHRSCGSLKMPEPLWFDYEWEPTLIGFRNQKSSAIHIRSRLMIGRKSTRSPKVYLSWVSKEIVPHQWYGIRMYKAQGLSTFGADSSLGLNTMKKLKMDANLKPDSVGPNPVCLTAR